MFQRKSRRPHRTALQNIVKDLPHGAGIAERVSALDWLSLRYAAIITLPVSKPGLCPQTRHSIILASSVDRDVNVGPIDGNWLRR